MISEINGDIARENGAIISRKFFLYKKEISKFALFLCSSRRNKTSLYYFFILFLKSEVFFANSRIFVTKTNFELLKTSLNINFNIKCATTFLQNKKEIGWYESSFFKMSRGRGLSPVLFPFHLQGERPVLLTLRLCLEFCFARINTFFFVGVFLNLKGFCIFVFPGTKYWTPFVFIYTFSYTATSIFVVRPFVHLVTSSSTFLNLSPFSSCCTFLIQA